MCMNICCTEPHLLAPPAGMGSSEVWKCTPNQQNIPCHSLTVCPTPRPSFLKLNSCLSMNCPGLYPNEKVHGRQQQRFAYHHQYNISNPELQPRCVYSNVRLQQGQQSKPRPVNSPHKPLSAAQHEGPHSARPGGPTSDTQGELDNAALAQEYLPPRHATPQVDLIITRCGCKAQGGLPPRNASWCGPWC
jgi:hypothetical protein